MTTLRMIICSMSIVALLAGSAAGQQILTTPEMKAPNDVLFCTAVNVHPTKSMDMKVELVSAEEGGRVEESETCEDVLPYNRCIASHLGASSFRFCRFTVKDGKHVRAAIQAELSGGGETAALPAW